MNASCPNCGCTDVRSTTDKVTGMYKFRCLLCKFEWTRIPLEFQMDTPGIGGVPLPVIHGR